MDKLDKEDLDKIKLNTLYEIKFISELAKKYYDKVVNDVKKMQTIFKICIDLVYQLKINDYTKVLTKDLTKEQRFFLFNQVNNYPFKEIANNFRTINSLDYSYDYIDTKIPEIIVAIIKATDLEGKKISRKYKYETNNLYTAFYITLFNIISIKNWHIKICGNCGRYFLIQKENVSYCERITNKNETCKDIGSKEQQKRKLENQPIYARYRRIQQIKCVYASRYKKDFFFKNDYENFNKMANKFKSDIKKGEATIEEFDKWLDTQDKTKKQD